MNKKKWLNLVKWLWTAIVVIGVGYYFSRHYQDSLTYIKNVTAVQLVLSVALLVLGKLFLAEMSRLSVVGASWKPSFSKMFHLYSTIQLSKYLPGGVWHFVGRFGVYRVNGLDNRQASQSILVENFWLISSALLFGGMVCLTNNEILALIGLPASGLLKVSLPLACLLVWLLTNTLIARFVLKHFDKPASLVRQVLIQSAVWLFIGLSFFVLLPVRIMGVGTATLAIGGFSIGWALGYITIFAPSGIGIREAVITAILATYIPPQEAAIYAAISRLVWIVTEVGLSIFAELVFGSGKLSTLFQHGKENQDLPPGQTP